MRYFAIPQNLPESYSLAMLLLRLSGLFPFHYDVTKNSFIISRKFFSLTVLHTVVYMYVNITSLMENWKDFSQPMMGHSSLTAFGNLILRLGAMVITFIILAPLLIGSRYVASSLNIYVQIIEDFIKLGIDVKYIYRRIYIISLLLTFTIAVSLVFTAWHSIYFYELITNRPPALKYYLMAFLANFYKVLYMFYGGLQFYTIKLMSEQMNGFLKTVLHSYREDYEKQMLMKDVLKRKNKLKW